MILSSALSQDNPQMSAADDLSVRLVRSKFSTFLGTPCGILAPLYERLERDAALRTVVREDNAVAMACGMAMAGESPVVLMQNSGLGQCVNVLASLTVPYEIPGLYIIGMRGTGIDTTPENRVMGHATEAILERCGIAKAWLAPGGNAEAIEWAEETVINQRASAALLIGPQAFGWKA